MIFFKKIEEWSIKNKKGTLGLFRARRLGDLAYLGLLKIPSGSKTKREQTI
jgi:hypothetical protein